MNTKKIKKMEYRYEKRLKKLIELTGTLEKNTYLHNELNLVKMEVDQDIADLEIKASVKNLQYKDI